jgi:hypothetical protein
MQNNETKRGQITENTMTSLFSILHILEIEGCGEKGITYLILESY